MCAVDVVAAAPNRAELKEAGHGLIRGRLPSGLNWAPLTPPGQIRVRPVGQLRTAEAGLNQRFRTVAETTKATAAPAPANTVTARTIRAAPRTATPSEGRPPAFSTPRSSTRPPG